MENESKIKSLLYAKTIRLFEISYITLSNKKSLRKVKSIYIYNVRVCLHVRIRVSLSLFFLNNGDNISRNIIFDLRDKRTEAKKTNSNIKSNRDA